MAQRESTTGAANSCLLVILLVIVGEPAGEIRSRIKIRSMKAAAHCSLISPLSCARMSAAVAAALHRRVRSGQCASTQRGGYRKARTRTMSTIIDTIEKEQQKTDVTNFKVGDGVRVHTRVREGDKERIQIFGGIVIGRKGRGINETFTVRRISYGEGVERVFPVHSPRIAKVEVEKPGRARRAKLNYLRGRKGKEATAVRE